ncbi:hypothetical protein KDX38_13615 [Pseudomonas sp. CDFA 602]|uniref:hypothetical protein n=1 Tax=Pseudomonas californiensis TaxID=2829823 RepID=UPI001E5C047F|nr:hypothetical protein [Pseudomonas californiensis]MCD5994766.1 hypothetical protein [Pseudomonas californiensis]MCD6000249.1 hypothetical protein [Pseudomonas californiensis]
MGNEIMGAPEQIGEYTGASQANQAVMGSDVQALTAEVQEVRPSIEIGTAPHRIAD